jgi:hypothetical protein
MDPELLSLDDLPSDARSLIEASDRQIEALREQSSRQADDIRARAERQAAEIESQANKDIQAVQLELLKQLKPLQDQVFREGNLDGALAIRERVRGLKAALVNANSDPGSLAHIEEPEIGSSLLFEVTGTTDGSVWGTDVYTGDSTLAAAAVHAGILQNGEQGVIRVTFVDTINVTFTGSTRNGIESRDFEGWPTGYRVSRG